MKNIVIVQNNAITNVQQAADDNLVIMQYNNLSGSATCEVLHGEIYHSTLPVYIADGIGYVQLPKNIFDGSLVHIRLIVGDVPAPFIHILIKPDGNLAIARVTDVIASNYLTGDPPTAIDSWDVLDPNKPPSGWGYDPDTGTFYKKEMPPFYVLDGRTFAGIKCGYTYTRDVSEGSASKVNYSFGGNYVEENYEAKLFIASQGLNNKILVRQVEKIDVTKYSKITARLSTAWSPYGQDGPSPVCQLVVSDGSNIVKAVGDARYIKYQDMETTIAAYHDLELDVSELTGEYNIGILIYNQAVKSSYDNNNVYVEEIRLN